MNRRKCERCGLVNFAVDDTCRRCGAPLDSPETFESPPPTGHRAHHRVGQRFLWLLGVIVTVIFLWSRSLLLSSEPIDENQRQIVFQAIRLLEQSGFSREVLMLRHFANYRATDNWWNQYLGHREAYAATNFPLGVVTLYPPFFNVASDDTERAAILFHEAQHLWGASEDAALERVWREKQRLGWTADRYGSTKVWRNTRDWTVAGVPALFQCGAALNGDCTR